MPADTKNAVRDRLRALRRAQVPQRDRAADARDLAVAGLEAGYAAGLAPGDWVAAYEPMRNEPPVEGLVDALVARGIRVMVPVTRTDWDLDWREVGDTDLLGTDAVARATVVFLPAHGVDRAGTRIGQGKGCYDRVVPRTSALLVAVVHPWEVLDTPLPREPHDRDVDGVITAGSSYRPLR